MIAKLQMKSGEPREGGGGRAPAGDARADAGRGGRSHAVFWVSLLIMNSGRGCPPRNARLAHPSQKAFTHGPHARLSRLGAHLHSNYVSPCRQTTSTQGWPSAGAHQPTGHRVLPAAPPVPDDLDEQLEFFRTNGFVFLRHAIEGDVLRRAQAAFTGAAAEPRAAWEVATDSGRKQSDSWQAQRYFDIPKVLEVDPVFLEVAESPQLLRLARRIVSVDCALFQYQARVYPSDPPDIDQQQGYTGYHNDGVFDRGDAWRRKHHQPVNADSAQTVMRKERRHLVVILTLFDLSADGGASSVVGGSSHLNRNPPSSQPVGAVCAAGPAGSAIVFDTRVSNRCLHIVLLF